MSKTKLFSQLIQSLEDPEFDKLASLYCSEVEGLVNIISCNGPYDSGLDLRSANFDHIDSQYQATTRKKRFEKKIEEDLTKALKNVEEFGLPNKVTYFYSYELTNSKVLTYKKMAKEKFGLFLTLIEAKTLSEISKEYKALSDLLYEISDLERFKTDDEYFDNVKAKSFYDLMSFGTSNDIKHSIIQSYVLNHLYDNSLIEITELLNNINSHFETKINGEYFESFINKLCSDRKIRKVENNSVQLTAVEKERLVGVLEVFKNEEALLKKQLSDILLEYKIENLLDEIIGYLSKIYESNFSINLGEFTSRNLQNQDLRTTTERFSNFLKENLGNQENESQKLVKKLLLVSDNNEILARIASGRVYSKVSSPDKLQTYITQNNNNKDIFLDTNVIIYLIFVHYEPDACFNTFHFNSAKHLLYFVKEKGLNLKTIKHYALEAANIFKEALSIVPFTKLPVFENLGGSSNIIHKFYVHLKDLELLDSGIDSFEIFLADFRFKQKKSDFDFLPQMTYLLDSLDILIEKGYRYDIENVKTLILNDLKKNDRVKSSFAINNDAIMMMRLGDTNVDFNPMDPIFCTWDSSLIRLRKQFFDDYPSCTKWMMYNPSRLMDHFSMMNLEVKSGTLSNEVLSILEEDFSFQSKTQSLFDTMLSIINPDNEVGLKYTNKLAEIRDNDIIQINHSDESVSETGVDSKGIDVIFKDLVNHYAFNEEEGVFDLFKDLFTKETYFDDVLLILKDQLKVLSSNGATDENLLSSMDELLEKSKQSK